MTSHAYTEFEWPALKRRARCMRPCAEEAAIPFCLVSDDNGIDFEVRPMTYIIMAASSTAFESVFIEFSVDVARNVDLLEIEGLFTQGSRTGRTVGESVGGSL